jgi:flagellar biosynthesis protein FlhF
MMIEETFVASNPQNAYALAVEKYGTKIKIISARQIKSKEGEIRSEIKITLSQSKFMKKSALKKPSKHTVKEKLLNTELKALQKELALMHERLANVDDSSIRSKVKNMFIQKGIAQTWLEEVCISLMGSSILDDEAKLISYLLEELDEALEIQKEDLSCPKIVMLVGPTGVGKTTTIAKLSARYAYMLDKPYKVGLINLDSYKVGAYEQFSHYANLMQIEHFSVATVKAFIKALAKFNAYDVILVDTAGMSPYDTKKFMKVIEFVQSNTPRKLETHLVLSATVKYEDMEDIYKYFSFLNLSSVLVSKFDETKHFGTLLNFMLLSKLPMSYFSTGQEVPDDLLLASKEYLLEQFIGDLHEA